jgi:hypothetical protein
MRCIPATLCVLILGFTAPAMAAAGDEPEGHKKGSSQSITLDDIGRGLKGAAKNIGDEIPKIGPAIGDTFKKVTGQDNAKETQSTMSSAQSSKRQQKK